MRRPNTYSYQLYGVPHVLENVFQNNPLIFVTAAAPISFSPDQFTLATGKY
jgi:hypothetical protein